MTISRSLIAFLIVGALLWPASDIAAQSQTPAHTPPRGAEAYGTVGIAYGQRNFIDFDIPGGVDTDEGIYWAQTYTLGATLRRDFLLISGSLALQHWIPEARTEAENNVQFQDLTFTTRYAGLTLPGTAFEISPAVTLALPTSQDSVESNLLFGAELGLDTRWYVTTRVQLSFSASLRQNSHSDPGRAAELSQASLLPPPNGFAAFDTSAVVRPTNRYGGPAMMMPTMLHRTQPAVSRVFSQGIAVELKILEPLYTRLGYGLYQFVGYANQDEDELAPEPGAMTLTMQASTIDVLFQPTDWVVIGASTATFRGLTPPDEDRLQFPLWNVEDGALNQSKLRLYATFYL